METADIKKAGLKVTLPRMKILELLENSEDRHHFDGGHAVFEINDGEHHDHLVDITTGRVVEFFDETIEQRQKEIAAKFNFTVTEHTMVLYGHFKDKNPARSKRK